MRRHHVVRQVLIAAEETLDQRVIDLVFAETLAIGLLDATGITSAENRLTARCSLRHARTSTHRRHRNQGAIAQTVLLDLVLDRLGQTLDEFALLDACPIENRESTLLLSQFDRGLISTVANRGHDLVDDLQRFFRIVFALHQNECICHTSDSQTNPSIGSNGFLNLGHRMAAHIVFDYVI